jgi:large subunit ribosomal protein L20
MVRVTRAPARKRRIKRLLKHSKGFVGDRGNHHQQASSAVMKAWSYMFRDRKQKKREFRSVWITRINAACRCHEISYSRLIDGLTKASIDINRKMLANLAIEDPTAFGAIVAEAKKALA